MHRQRILRTAAPGLIAATMVLMTSSAVSAGGPTTDMTITKVHNAAPFVRGSNESYSITVHNNGPTGLSGTGDNGLQALDTLPVGLTFVSATGTDWTCSAVGQAVTCNRTNTAAAVASGASAPVITLTVAVALTAPSTISNTATIGTAGNGCCLTDSNPTNNASTDTVAVVDPATPTPTPAPTAAPTPTSLVAPATGSAPPADSTASWTPLIIVSGLLLVVSALAWRRRPV